MTAHVEWADAKVALPFLYIEEPGKFLDSYGTANDKPALIVGGMNDYVAIEGSPDDLVALGQRIVTLAQRYYTEHHKKENQR
jgi:hypothetical protein